MTTVPSLLAGLNSGEIPLDSVPDNRLYSVASAIYLDGLKGPDELLGRLSTLQRDLLGFQKSLIEGDLTQAIDASESLLHRSRSPEERDAECEVRLRIERALIGAVDEEAIGAELRWCVDRLNAMMPESPLHGIAILNLAAWHTSIGEVMMAMAIHADISQEGGHLAEIRGLSRLEVGRILTTMRDLDPAMRHLWTAREIFLANEMQAEAVIAGLEWLDLALEGVSADAPTMSERIRDSEPRELPGDTWIDSNPSDVREVIETLLPILMKDVSGEERNDLGLIFDAAAILPETSWSLALGERIDEIQDSRLLDVLQS